MRNKKKSSSNKQTESEKWIKNHDPQIFVFYLVRFATMMESQMQAYIVYACWNNDGKKISSKNG